MTGVAPVLGVLAVVVGIADTIPYVRDTLRGATRPHRGTWLIWSVLAIVVCLSQRADGASWSLLMAAAQAVLISLVFILAIRRGEGGVSAGDRILIAIAGGGVAGWMIAEEPMVATVCVVVADLIGATMMLPKTYRDPDSETLATYALASLGGALAAGAVGAPDVSLLLYPIYFGLVNGALAILDPPPARRVLLPWGVTTGDNRDVVRRISSPIFIGRAAELAALDAALAAAQAGTASTVLVSGEAGIGKTRLLAEFAARAGAGGTRVLIGNCIELGDGELPHAPLAAILRQLESELRPRRARRRARAGARGPGPGRAGEPGQQARAGAGDARPARRARAGRHRDRGPPLGRSLHARPAGVPDPQPAPRADRARRDLPQRRAASSPPAAPVPQRSRRRCRADRARRASTRTNSSGSWPRSVATRPTRELAARLLARSEGNAFLAEELLAAGGAGAARHTARRDDGARRAGVGRRQVGAARRRVRRTARAPPPARGDGGAVGARARGRTARGRQPPRAGAQRRRRVRVPPRAVARGPCMRTSCPGERARLHAAIARALAGAPDLASESAAVAAAELAHHWKAAHELGAAARGVGRRRPRRGADRRVPGGPAALRLRARRLGPRRGRRGPRRDGSDRPDAPRRRRGEPRRRPRASDRAGA